MLDATSDWWREGSRCITHHMSASCPSRRSKNSSSKSLSPRRRRQPSTPATLMEASSASFSLSTFFSVCVMDAWERDGTEEEEKEEFLFILFIFVFYRFSGGRDGGEESVRQSSRHLTIQWSPNASRARDRARARREGSYEKAARLTFSNVADAVAERPRRGSATFPIRFALAALRRRFFRFFVKEGRAATGGRNVACARLLILFALDASHERP